MGEMSQEEHIQQLIGTCSWQEELMSKQAAKIQHLEQQLAYLQRMLFGRKSERHIDPNQLTLGLDIEEAASAEVEPTPTTQKTERKTNRPVRQQIPKHLPRVIEELLPDNLPEGARKIGEEASEVMEYTPGRLWVRRTVRPKFTLPNNGGVVIADLPSQPIPKGNAGASLLAHIAVSKHADHVPFYRLCGILKRSGVSVSESTMNGWNTATFKLLMPLYEVLKQHVLQNQYLQVDETPIPVLTEKKPGATHRGYHWVYFSPVLKSVFFDYNESRERAAAETVLKDYQGTIQTDGYAAYLNMKTNHRIKQLACWAHVRRYFEKALTNDPDRANYALTEIKRLYAIEREAQDMDDKQRCDLRQEKAIPILKRFYKWLIHQDNVMLLPKSYIGKAFDYTRKLWDKLSKYTEAGHYRIDNNLVENSIRPVALGRKNYLFAGSHEGAKRAAMMYSFMGTCKMHDVEPYQWLTDVLSRMQEHKVNRLHELLPQNWKVYPEN